MRARLVLSILIPWMPFIVLLGVLHAAPPDSSAIQSTTVVSLDGRWLLAPDPENIGRDRAWWQKPAAEAKSARVPGIIQEAFPLYHGAAWYWREVTPPANLHAQGRYLLRFWNVDYLADVWLNGVHVGRHEGACEPFVLDVTDAIKPKAANRLALRVLNPTNCADRRHQALGDRPHGQITGPVGAGPRAEFRRHHRFRGVDRRARLRVDDLFVRPDPRDRPDSRAGQCAQRWPAARRGPCRTVRRTGR